MAIEFDSKQDMSEKVTAVIKQDATEQDWEMYKTLLHMPVKINSGEKNEKVIGYICEVKMDNVKKIITIDAVIGKTFEEAFAVKKEGI